MEITTIKEKSKNVKPNDWYNKLEQLFSKVYKESCSDWVQGLREYDEALDKGVVDSKDHYYTKEHLDSYAEMLKIFTIDAQLKNAHKYNGEFDIRSDYLLSKGVLDLCYEAVEGGFAFSNYVFFILQFFWIYGESGLNSFESLDFVDFSFTNEEIFILIRKNEKWHNIERDLEIYQERKKGIYLDKLGERFGLKVSAVSLADKKVQGSINYWEGKLFENFVEKRLKDSNLFEKVIKEAGKGEADILAYTKDNRLFIYSLKNLKVKRKPFWLMKEELRPELERALLQSLDYQVHLILLVFDNYHGIIKQFNIDFHNPENIDLAGD